MAADNWIKLTISYLQLPLHIDVYSIAAFRPANSGRDNETIIYFGGTKETVTESCDEIRTLLGIRE